MRVPKVTVSWVVGVPVAVCFWRTDNDKFQVVGKIVRVPFALALAAWLARRRRPGSKRGAE